MKTFIAVLAVCMVLSFAFIAHAQAAGDSLASTLEVYVFPSDGQDSSQQAKDESECYNWAVSNSGTDPFQLSKEASAQQQQAAQAQQQASQTGQNEAGRGLLRGAAAGALIGEIADDDAGKGAAYGAAIGAVRGGRRGRDQRNQAEQQAAQNSQQQQQAITAQGDNFKKAFSVCLEAKSYMVKY